jgi:hypothetical protein
MKIILLGVLGFIVAETVSLAQFGVPAEIDWQAVRKAQPEGLQLKMTLPKDHFYQGEIIPASLEFSNASQNPYHLWIGTYDRSGRIPDIAFKAYDAANQPVADPLAWYFMMGGMGGGLGNEQDLGTWTISLPVNQWLRFDKPGVYTLFAWSSRVQKGSKQKIKARTHDLILVSDKVQITIDPLPPGQEEQIIAQAEQSIALGGKGAMPAADQLRFLETVAARAELIRLLSQPPMSFAASMGLCAAPDPVSEAPAILTAVSDGKLPLREDISSLYAQLKTHDLIVKFLAPPFGPQVAQQRSQELAKAMAQASDEIAAAALKASGGKGDAYIQVILTKYQQNSGDPAVRAELVQHQLELSNEQANWLLEGWDELGKEDFLPLARKMAGAPTYSLAAFMALVKSKPDEARALMIADASAPKSNIFTNNRGSFQYDRVHLAPSPTPELDSVLRDKLAAGTNLEPTLFYIDEFATPALLPDLIALYQPHEGKWACELQKFVLRYWIRCDPKGGIAALSRALQSRAVTGCYKNVLDEVLTERWNDNALPLVIQSLNDPDQDVVLGAIKVLAIHGDPAGIDKSIAALERLNGPVATTTPSSPATMSRTFGQASMVAKDLLEDKNVQFTPKQQQRLQVIANGH